MKSERVKELFNTLSRVLLELESHFDYNESVVDQQHVEVKRLRFEVSGQRDKRKVEGMAAMKEIYDSLPTPEECGLVGFEEAGTGRKLEFREEAEEWVVQFGGKGPWSPLSELVIEGCVKGVPVPGPVIAEANRLPCDGPVIRDAARDGVVTQLFDVQRWKWCAYFDAAEGTVL